MRRRYDFYSFFLIPALTILLASGFSLTGTNFSVIGNAGGRSLFFRLWGACAGNYACLYLEDMLDFAGCAKRRLRLGLRLALALFVCGVGLPYRPEVAPMLARVHVACSFGGPALLLLAVLYFLRVLERETSGGAAGERGGFAALRMLALLLAGISGVLYLYFQMITGLLELFLTFSICVYLALLQAKIEKIYLSNH